MTKTKKLNRDKVAEMIQKLIALQESPNEHEAALAAAKVQELLTKYNMDLAEIQPITADVNLVVEGYAYDWEYVKTLPDWMMNLAQVIAQYTYTTVVYSGRPRVGAAGSVCRSSIPLFLGRKVAVDVACGMYLNLTSLLLKLAGNARKEYTKNQKDNGESLSGYSHPSVYRNSWLFGSVSGIHDAFEEERRLFMMENENKGSAMVVAYDLEIDQYIEDKFGKLGSINRTSNKKMSAQGIHDGQVAGAGVDVSKTR